MSVSKDKGGSSSAALETALGHVFTDKSLLHLALAHASANAANESYERLEFLGDRVLGLILADEYYRRCPNDNEGQLSLRLHASARQSALVEIAVTLNLAPLINTQPGMDVEANPSILGDVVESLIAALYLDAGMGAATAFVLKYWTFQTGPIGTREKDAKSRLQEAVMEQGLPLPRYRLVNKSGPDHSPEMIYEASVEGMAPVLASGGNRKMAEQEAARLMLVQMQSSALTNEAGKGAAKQKRVMDER